MAILAGRIPLHYAKAKKSISKSGLGDETEAQAWYQFQFFSQWLSLKPYANSRDVQIFGDIPIFVAMDSADVWTNPHLVSNWTRT